MKNLDKTRAGKIVALRILLIALFDLAVIVLFNFVRGEANRELAFHAKVLPVLRIVSLVLLVAALAYWVITLIKRVDTSAHPVTPLMLVAAFAHLLATSLLYDKFRITPFLFYTMTIIVSILFVVYYVYTILLYRK